MAKGNCRPLKLRPKQGIPESYLVQLMNTLNRCGLVQSRRGPQGGHRLAVHPSEVNLHTVMTALDGNSSPLDCLTYGSDSDCIFVGCCAQQEIWKSVEDAIESVLSDITLEHLAQRQTYLTTPISL